MPPHLSLHEIDPDVEIEKLPEAVLPQLPFSWSKPPSFYIKEMTHLVECILEESRKMPTPAYEWSDSISFYMYRAATSSEVVSLVDFVRQYGRLGSRVRFSSVNLVHCIQNGESFPELDLPCLFREGKIQGIVGCTTSSSFFTVPEEYMKYLPLVLRERATDNVVLSPVVDSEGICYLVLGNGDQAGSKHRKAEFDGLQACTDKIWQEGKTNLFELPTAIMVDYLCFKVIASPLQLWLQDEPSPEPFRENPSIPMNCNLWVCPSSKKLLVDCSGSPLTSPACCQENIDLLVKEMRNLRELGNPFEFRSTLKKFSVPVRFLGKVLLSLNLPVLKQIVADEMIGRMAKWWIRQRLLANLDVTPPAAHLIDMACKYFQVSVDELEPFCSQNDSVIDPFRSRFIFSEKNDPEFHRALFPHWEFLETTQQSSHLSSIPGMRLICPRPQPRMANETVALAYACGVFRLEMAVATGSVLESVCVISDLVKIILKMRQKADESPEIKEALRLRALALASAAQTMVPSCLPVPPTLQHAILECVPSTKIYNFFRQSLEKSSLLLCCLDNQMAKSLFLADRASEALPIINGAAERAEKILGARHPLTVGVWIRKAQIIKKICESDGSSHLIQQGIKCLNKAMSAAENSFTDLLDPSSFSHHLLSLFHMWNGEPSKAVAISRSGLVRLDALFGRQHPRFLNSAFLHAKLLEAYCASSGSTDAAREAVSILEEILDTLIEIADESGAIATDFREFNFEKNDPMFSPNIELRRKLAICALILKFQVWLLDPRSASDLMDFVVADKLEGTRGVAILPRKNVVRNSIKQLLESKKTGVKFFPVLELATSLPENVLDCCNSALTAKSKGVSVSAWFADFHQATVRTIGTNESLRKRELLIDLFLTFVFVNDNGFEYVGPLSAPLIPKPTRPEIFSSAAIYREWEQSAALYCLDHGLYE